MINNQKTSNTVEKHPIRILHVVGGMDRGGVETWLMHILRNIDRDRFHMDFLIHTDKPCSYDQEIRELGSQIIPCLNPSQPLTFATNFKRIIHSHKPYDIIHSHIHHYSGYVLWLAYHAKIPVRIAHSHLDSSLIESKSSWSRQLYLNLMRGAINRYTTIGLGCSEVASRDLFGKDWKSDQRWQIFYCSIDLKPFQSQFQEIDPTSVRDELGIPKTAFVVGHVGQFRPQKNHPFLLKIFAEVLKQETHAYLLLVGDGALRSDIEQQAVSMGISDRIVFLGSRSDIPHLMLGAMDVFLFPSFYEGLGLVLIEAQAAGLPCIFSDTVPQEAELVKPLMHRLSLSQPPSVWSEQTLAARKIGVMEALAIVSKSPFNIETNVRQLEELYLG